MDNWGDRLYEALHEGDVHCAFEISQHLKTFEPCELAAIFENPYPNAERVLTFLKSTQSLLLSEISHHKSKAQEKPFYCFMKTSEQYFYKRMGVLLFLLSLGVVFEPNQRVLFLQWVLREYSCDQWGNLESIPIKESRKREECLSLFFKGFDRDDQWLGCEHSLDLLKLFSFERDNVYAFMCDKGVFDKALLFNVAKTQDMLLISLTKRHKSFTLSGDGLFVSNLDNRSFLLKRCLRIGAVNISDCTKAEFSLLDIMCDKACVTETLMEQGMRLPKLNSSLCLYSPRYTLEQVLTWARFDVRGMLEVFQPLQEPLSSFYFFVEHLRRGRHIFASRQSDFESFEAEQEYISGSLFSMWQGLWAERDKKILQEGLEGRGTDTGEGTTGKGKKKM